MSFFDHVSGDKTVDQKLFVTQTFGQAVRHWWHNNMGDLEFPAFRADYYGEFPIHVSFSQAMETADGIGLKPDGNERHNFLAEMLFAGVKFPNELDKPKLVVKPTFGDIVKTWAACHGMVVSLPRHHEKPMSEINMAQVIDYANAISMRGKLLQEFLGEMSVHIDKATNQDAAKPKAPTKKPNQAPSVVEAESAAVQHNIRLINAELKTRGYSDNTLMYQLSQNVKAKLKAEYEAKGWEFIESESALRSRVIVRPRN